MVLDMDGLSVEYHYFAGGLDMKKHTTFGDRLREARERNGLTQQELGEAMGVDQQRIQKLETGVTKTYKERFVIDLAGKLDVSPAWLALGEEDIEKLSGEAFDVARMWDQLSAESRSKILIIVLKDREESLKKE